MYYEKFLSWIYTAKEPEKTELPVTMKSSDINVLIVTAKRGDRSLQKLIKKYITEGSDVHVFAEYTGTKDYLPFLNNNSIDTTLIDNMYLSQKSITGYGNIEPVIYIFDTIHLSSLLQNEVYKDVLLSGKDYGVGTITICRNPCSMPVNMLNCYNHIIFEKNASDWNSFSMFLHDKLFKQKMEIQYMQKELKNCMSNKTRCIVNVDDKTLGEVKL